MVFKMSGRIFFLLCCAIFLVNYGNCAKILGIFPASSKSHWALGKALFKELARRGHDLTVISWYEEKNLPSNYSYKTILLHKEARSPPINFFKNVVNPYTITAVMNKMGAGIVDHTLEQPQLKKLLEKNVKFDMIIQDQFINDGLAYLAHRFDAHRVLFFTGISCAWVNNLVGNPAPPSAVPEILLEFSTFMTFWQRVQNALFYVYSELNRQFVFFPQQEALIRKHFPNDGKSLRDLNYNVSLVLLNAHESYADPVVLVPNMKNVGGLHIEAGEDLPQDLRKYLDDATEGVVYFSMGSNLRSKDLPTHVRDAILAAFAKLKVKVLWKWEDDVLPGQPGNVKLEKWLPQQAVLAHPNVKVFVTHGGLLSTTEAVYNGKPILAIPVYGDQKVNAASAAQKGYAINLPYQEFESGKFEAGLKELLENPKYQENAALRSKLYHDRPRKPLDEAVYWVEYVLRHKGAEHLRVAALNLSWYQYLLLDVAAFIVVISGVVVFFIGLLLKKLFCKKKVKTQ